MYLYERYPKTISTNYIALCPCSRLGAWLRSVLGFPSKLGRSLASPFARVASGQRCAPERAMALRETDSIHTLYKNDSAREELRARAKKHQTREQIVAALRVQLSHR